MSVSDPGATESLSSTPSAQYSHTSSPSHRYTRSGIVRLLILAEHDAPPVPGRASVQLAGRVVFEGETALSLYDGVERRRQGGRVVDVDGRAVADRLRDSVSSGFVGGAGGAVAGHCVFSLTVPTTEAGKSSRAVKIGRWAGEGRNSHFEAFPPFRVANDPERGDEPPKKGRFRSGGR